MTIYIHAVGYAFGYGAVFVGGIVVGVLHERHHLRLLHRRRARRL